ncbi:hypothetical protein FT663_03300 [Candidozyma haemuli var. vulneris]|uniref:Phosphoribulokinase/uridine kinase domain-containing protein n=1 Tax=Candidozyma haemuli TaxID=45357 RepID=A0A2V1AWR7_9ASCO|nr:hypothetical protein CXQ85_000284 [[Candida] haemuloni]KAF3988448.1 hypothetical protein FT662_03397 [[Candida] haemuloni var. vulneris]KAF3990151.1 hypothetical protein FT663_03300 [[Candida] haemuloni var. vulneris]PVH21311.1 hypothetical protein CXQ85_000284 [[Candida] haemuloni]
MNSNAVVVLIGGGHAAGKRTTARWIKEDLGKVVSSPLEVEVIDMDDYCNQKSLSVGQDHDKNSAITVTANRAVESLKPSRFDFAALQRHIEEATAASSSLTKVIIVHGLYALYEKAIRDLSQIKVFISGDADARLIRWIRRDVLGEVKKAQLENIINAYLHGAKQEMNDYIFPTKEQADVIMPRGAEPNAIALIVDGLLPYLGPLANERMPEPTSSNILRPSDHSFKNEKFDAQKRKYYDVA